MKPDAGKGTFANNLRELRKYKNMSQAALAEALGISRNKIASYESRNIEPKLQLIVQIARFFEIGIDDLLKKELHKSNIESYKKHKKQARNSRVELKLKEVPNPKLVQILKDFKLEHDKARKIYEGLKAFYSLDKSEETKAELESEQMFELIEYMLEQNQKIIDDMV